MGIRIAAILTSAWLAAGAASFAAPGDVISHFSLSGNIYPVGAAMYRAATYAYGVYDAGTLLRAYHVATGSLVGSVPVPAADGVTYDATSGYYYGSADNYIYRITTAGSLVGSFSGGPDAGTLAATGTFAGQPGEYVIVNPKARGIHPTRVYTGGGSFVASFTIRGPYPTMDLRYGAVAGAGYPASFGTTMWLVLRTDFIWRSAYQIDLGNANPAIAPASLGAVKALFR